MKRILIFILLISIFLGIYPYESYSNPIQPEEQLTEEEENNLNELTIEEKQILESLFKLLQEIAEMEESERVTSIQIEELNRDIENIEVKIQDETRKYNENLSIMEELLKEYQKNGANSYIELILSSDSLSILLKRLNAIRDISRNTNNLLETLELSKNKLIEEKQNITDKLVLIEDKQKQLREALETKLKLKEDLEISLAELQDERLKYEEYLKALEDSFNEVKPLFTETINTLVKKIQDGEIPEESISISLSFPNIKGTIEEDGFNNILMDLNLPTKVEVILSEDKMELIMKEISIEMAGNLEILNDQALVFKVLEGRFMGLRLEDSTIEELFKGGYLELDFKMLLNKNKINSVKIIDNKMELLITPVLF